MLSKYTAAFARVKSNNPLLKQGMLGSQFQSRKNLLRFQNASMSFKFDKNGEKDSKSSNDYNKDFDDLLNRASTPLSQQEKDFIARQKEAKIIADEEAKKRTALDKEAQDQRHTQDFEDLVSGKNQVDSEKNLQQLFSEFYSKARTDYNVKNMANSAKASVGSLSGTLEERRQKFKKMKRSALDGDKKEDKATTTEADAEHAAKEEVKASETETKLKEEQKMDQATTGQVEQTPVEEVKVDSAKATDAESASEEKKVDPEVEKITEEIVKVGLKQRLTNKFSETAAKFNSKIEGRFPKAHAKSAYYFNYVSEVWEETFPKEHKRAISKIEARKERARLAKELEEKMEEMSPEELEEYYEQIPEWKRGALVLVEDQPGETEETKSVFRRFRDKVGEKIDETDAAKRYYESEEYERVKQIRKEVKEFKGDLRDQVDMSQNPVVQRVSQASDMVFSESQLAKAIADMQRYDPEFDLEELNYEAEEIFKEFFCNFLSGNMQYCEKVCASTALGFVKAHIQLREKEGWRYKYDELLTCGRADFQGGQIAERVPTFSYHIDVQELDDKVSLKDGSDIENEAISPILRNSYRIMLARHQEPDIEVTGHYWEIVEFYKLGEVRQIV